MIFFRMSTATLYFIVFGVIMGATAFGLTMGRLRRERSHEFKDSLGVVQAALLGFMGLVLAFGLTLAIGRYEARRTAVIAEANAINTSWLRAQTLPEPMRSASLPLLEGYIDNSIRISDSIPGGAAQRLSIARNVSIQRELWGHAGAALNTAPIASAPRLYVESLNQTFDAQITKVAGLANRVPSTVLLLEVAGAAIALGLLGMHSALLGRGVLTSILAAVLVSFVLLVTFDLDRPTRGFIHIPTAPLDSVRASMAAGPSTTGMPVP